MIIVRNKDVKRKTACPDNDKGMYRDDRYVMLLPTPLHGQLAGKERNPEALGQAHNRVYNPGILYSFSLRLRLS